MKHTIPVLASTVALLAACTAPLAVSPTGATYSSILQAAASATCCVSPKDARFDSPKPVGEPYDFRLSDTGSQINIEDIKSYYHAIKIPDGQVLADFRIESFSTLDEVGERHVVVPQILVLDDQFRVSRKSRPAFLQYMQDRPLWREKEGLSIYVRVDREVNSSEKYIIVLSTPSIQGLHLTYRPVPTPNVTLYYVDGTADERRANGSALPMRASPDGIIRITNLSSVAKRPFDRAFLF